MAVFPLRICSTLPESNALSFARVSQLEVTAEGEGDDTKTATPVTEYDRRATLVSAEPSKFPGAGVSMSAQAVPTFNRN